MKSATLFRRIILLASMLLTACAVSAAPSLQPTSRTLTLATTTSTQDSGLLNAIIPVFEKQNNAVVKVVAVGTGQALKLGEDGNADVVLVHARAQEDAFIKAGFGINRRDVMYNDFIVVGPTADPAGAKGSALSADALKKIAATSASFASRGDSSGTHTKEKELWKVASVTPTGSWYLSVGQGMGETLVFAHEKRAYTLTDRATWLAQKSRLADLTVIVGGDNIAQNADASLLNPYGVIPVNPARYPQLNAALAETFATWLTSADTQKLINGFGVDKYGQSLFKVAAKP